MELIIEIGRIGNEWRAAVLAGDELVAEAWGKDEAAARAALSQMIGERGSAAVAAPLASRSLGAPPPSDNPLKDTVSEAIRSHPQIRQDDRCSPETAKMHRYRTEMGRGVAHEHNLGPQHIWVAADGLPQSLGDIRQKFYPGGRHGDGRHSNLKVIPDLVNADLVRFSPKDTTEAHRIIDAVAALPPTPDA
jgi:hypothetical protein